MAIEAHATARYVRTSAQKAGLVMDLIRGRDVNRALATLQYTRKGIGARHRETAALGDCQRAAEGRVRRRRRSSVRVGVLREPGAVDEAHPPCPDGARVPRREAHCAPHCARRRAAGRDRGGRSPDLAEARRREGGRREGEERRARRRGEGACAEARDACEENRGAEEEVNQSRARRRRRSQVRGGAPTESY